MRFWVVSRHTLLRPRTLLWKNRHILALLVLAYALFMLSGALYVLSRLTPGIISFPVVPTGDLDDCASHHRELPALTYGKPALSQAENHSSHYQQKLPFPPTPSPLQHCWKSDSKELSIMHCGSAKWVNKHQGEPHENSSLIIAAWIRPSTAKRGVDIILYVPILTLAVVCPEAWNWC